MSRFVNLPYSSLAIILSLFSVYLYVAYTYFTSIHPSTHTHTPIHLLVHPLTHPSIHPLTHPPTHANPSTHSSIHPVTHLPTNPHIHSPTHTSIHPPTHTSIHTSIHAPTHPHIHTPTHTFSLSVAVDGGLSPWTKWSSCSDSCGIMERHRSCSNPKPAYGGKGCHKLPVQMRMCGSCTGTA